MTDTARIALALAALLTGLVAGFLFAFAVVVMPGIRRLGDRAYLRTFREIDGVIQRGDPLFGAVWLGSAAVLVLGVALGFGTASGAERALLAAATASFLLGVQLPTFVVNVPLNNQVKALDIEGADEETLRDARRRFESRWNRWNRLRTALAIITTALLVAVLAEV